MHDAKRASGDIRGQSGLSEIVQATVSTMAVPVTASASIADPPSSARSWAQVATVLDNEAPFQSVIYKHRRQPLLVGSKSTECSVRAGPRRLTCFVGRLDIETTAEDLTEYLSAAGVKGVKCVNLIPKDGRKFYSSAFRVSCDNMSKDLFYNDAVWTAGVELRDWVFHNRNGAA